MNVKEFLETIGIHWDECTNENDPRLYLEITIDVTIKGYKYQTRTIENTIIDKNNNTITLKGKL